MGFLLKLWRGEVSLGATYWIFGALVVVMFQMLEYAPIGDEEGSRVLRFISSVYYLFIAIAIFRSSVRYTGSRLFLVYTQLSAVGLLALVLWRIFFSSGNLEGISP